MILDVKAKQILDDNINMTVPWYLMAAYAYYEKDNPILSDSFFDYMGKHMLENWDSIEHFHKEYITLDDLKAGTFLGKYPSIVEDAVLELRQAKK